MTNQDLRTIKTHRDIEAGFIQVCQQKSFDKVTVNDICQAGLVGRSTFYHHYPDKYALLESLVDAQAQDFDQLLAERMTAPTQDELLITLYQALAGQANLLTVLLKIHTSSADLSQRYLTSLQQHLSGLLPELELAVPREFVLQLYASSALTAITWSLEHGDQEAIATFMNQLVKKVLIG